MNDMDRRFIERESALLSAHRVIAASLAAKRDLASNMMWLRLSLLSDKIHRPGDKMPDAAARG
jgi:hypothetical protein